MPTPAQKIKNYCETTRLLLENIKTVLNDESKNEKDKPSIDMDVQAIKQLKPRLKEFLNLYNEKSEYTEKDCKNFFVECLYVEKIYMANGYGLNLSMENKKIEEALKELLAHHNNNIKILVEIKKDDNDEKNPFLEAKKCYGMSDVTVPIQSNETSINSPLLPSKTSDKTEKSEGSSETKKSCSGYDVAATAFYTAAAAARCVSTWYLNGSLSLPYQILSTVPSAVTSILTMIYNPYIGLKSVSSSDQKFKNEKRLNPGIVPIAMAELTQEAMLLCQNGKTDDVLPINNTLDRIATQAEEAGGPLLWSCAGIRQGVVHTIDTVSQYGAPLGTIVSLAMPLCDYYGISKAWAIVPGGLYSSMSILGDKLGANLLLTPHSCDLVASEQKTNELALNTQKELIEYTKSVLLTAGKDKLELFENRIKGGEDNGWNVPDTVTGQLVKLKVPKNDALPKGSSNGESKSDNTNTNTASGRRTSGNVGYIIAAILFYGIALFSGIIQFIRGKNDEPFTPALINVILSSLELLITGILHIKSGINGAEIINNNKANCEDNKKFMKDVAKRGRESSEKIKQAQNRKINNSSIPSESEYMNTTQSTTSSSSSSSGSSSHMDPSSPLSSSGRSSPRNIPTNNNSNSNSSSSDTSACSLQKM